MKKDVPLKKSISELVSFEPDNKALEKIYEELEFNAWINSQNTKTRNFKDANQCNTNLYAKYFIHLLELGIYLNQSEFVCIIGSNIYYLFWFRSD